MNTRTLTNLLLIILLTLSVSRTRADEGMWLLGRTDPKAMAAPA